MEFDNQLRSLEHIRKSVPLALNKKLIRDFKFESHEDMNRQISKISIYKNKVEDFEKSVDTLLAKIKDLDSDFGT